jgi:hypothetical protein
VGESARPQTHYLPNRIVRETESYRTADAAGKLIKLPTGDGMVLPPPKITYN